MIDWNAKLQTKHAVPRVAQLLPPDGVTSKRRVRIGSDERWHLTDSGRERATTWLYDEAGCRSTLGERTEWDLVNA